MKLCFPSLLTLASIFDQTAGVTLSSETEIYPNDFQSQDNFGYAVAISGDIAVASTRQDDSSKGSISIITKDQSGIWSEDIKLFASDRTNGDRFGSDVGIHNNMVIVGSPNRDLNGQANVGRSYIYKKDDITGNWNENDILIGSTATANNKCGQSVSISKNSAMFGCGLNGDKAFIFEYDETSDTWKEVYNHNESPGFGFSVSIYEQMHAIIGDPYNGNKGYYAGSAYIITRDTTTGTWSRTQQLYASDAYKTDQFGYDVSICKDYAMVGAYMADVTGAGGNGVVYVYKRDANNDWIETQILAPSRIKQIGRFGNSISINCDENNYYAIIGMFEDDTRGNKVGSAFVFELDTNKNEWIETNLLEASEYMPGDRFGISVGAGGSDNCVIAGVPFHNHHPVNFPNVGSAFIYCPDTPPTSAPTEPTTPTYEISQCKAWGDPHFTTFDGSIFHFQGEGYFDYVKDCDLSSDINYPLTITGKHEICGNDVTCVREVLVQFQNYDNDGSLSWKYISFADGGNEVTFKNAGISALGTHSYHGPYGLMTINVGNNHFDATFNLNGIDTYIKFEYVSSTLIIETPVISSDICGLCGNLNDDATDEFTKCNNGEMIEFIESNTNIFGESCCRKDLDIRYIGESDCNPLVPPSKPPTVIPTECSDISEIACKDVYYQYCGSCINSEPDEEFLQGCSYDVCSMCGEYITLMNMDVNNINIDMLISMECFDSSINFCNVNCEKKGNYDVCDYNSWKHLAGESVNLYQYYDDNGKDHIYSLSSNGGSGLLYEGIIAKIWTNEIKGVLVPLYEYEKEVNGLIDHYYSVNKPPLSGWNYHGNIIGYVMNEGCESFNVPFYMYYSSELMDHFYSANWEGNGFDSYKYESTAGYVMESEATLVV